MKNIIKVIDNTVEWMTKVIYDLQIYLAKKAEIRRRKQIEKMVTKLWRLDALWRIPVDNLNYVEKKLKEEGRDYIWEVDYRHKYLFGKDELDV